MFARLGRFTHRRRRWVLVAAALLTAVAGWLGPGVADAVQAGGFEDEGSESARAARAVAAELGRTDADVVLLYQHPTLAADDPAFARAVQDALATIPDDDVEQVLHPWSPGLPEQTRAALLGADGRTAMALVTVAGTDTDTRIEAWTQLEEAVRAPAPFTTVPAGPLPVNGEMSHMAEGDIVRAEVLAMPVLLVLMALIFGSLTAAALPVVVGVVAILGAMGLLRAMALVTDVSTFALNVTTILGLGLAIDYALFVVSRFREELAARGDVGAAVERTVATAGRTVAFSGVTVLVAFAGLLFFPQTFLRSMGLGGMAVVLLDMVLALTLLPALLAVLGRRVDSGRLPRSLTARLAGRRDARRSARTTATPRTTGWERVARGVLRRPGLVVVGAVALLAVVALPALDLRTGTSDVRDLPAWSDSRQAADELARQFPDRAGTTLEVLVRGTWTDAALAAYVTDAGGLPSATGASVVAAEGDATLVRVTTDAVVDAPAARELVEDARALAAPPGAEVLVGGPAAVTADANAAIARTLPGTLAFVAGVTVVLLFLALGSVVLPLKAVVMNVLSLGATLGVVVWGFGQGHLAQVLDFTETSRVEPGNLVLIGLIAFGLAMDYELFLLSRVREEHLRGADDVTAITRGLQRSGRTITSAALLLVVVLASMTTSGITFLKLVGLGLAFAVAVDATVVRALLVPAAMRLLGRANWWLPRPLARVHARFGLAEDDGEPAPAVPPDVAPLEPALAGAPAGR